MDTKINEIEEVIEDEINRLWKSGATLENATKAAARLRRILEEKECVDKSGS